QTTIQVQELEDACWNALLDDMNTPIAIAHLFEWVRVIGHLQRGEERITPEELNRLRAFFSLMVYDILGLQDEGTGKEGGVKEQAALDTAMQLALEYRAEAKGRKDYTTADRIRNTLNDAGVEVMDSPQGVNWRLK
ncbi:MAG: cysteine--tRNA ligase, partial [Bacteroidia bacterium]|nr:cysteine--tRNA ligase [Bacteroidia bacterium]